MREAVIHPNSLKFSLKMFSAVAAGYVSDSLFPKSFGLPPAPYPPVLPPIYHLSISLLTSLNLIYIPTPPPLFFINPQPSTSLLPLKMKPAQCQE